jgi:nucleoside-diphosphate-sugar epimerase
MPGQKILITGGAGFLRIKMHGVDQVVHCAAALPLYDPKDIFTTDVEGTRTLLEAAQRQGVQRFIHISSTAVYGVPDHHPLYEGDRLDGVGPYGQAKIEFVSIEKAEQQLGYRPRYSNKDALLRNFQGYRENRVSIKHLTASPTGFPGSRERWG